VKETIKARKIIDPGFWSLEERTARKAGKAVISRRGAKGAECRRNSS
jgi:hypothetical protein